MTETKWKIRDAIPEDAATVTAFNLACAEESEGMKLDTGRLRAGVEAVLADAGRGRYFLAEDERGVAGQVMITFEWSDWRNAWVWWLQSVYVRPDVRRAGVFSALMQHVETEARRAAIPLVRLYVEHDNEVAERTYRANGFEAAPYRLLRKALGSDA
ncbi:MAG TPA: GNAT family N-acetyltransferase [Gammaproteobacteria bacterium]|nr:GNAT family N-acetyltransferase [Gammaproteobacteria bacterium]